MSRKIMSPGWIMRSEKVCECGRPRGPDTEFTHSTRSEPMRNSRSLAIATSSFSLVPGPDGAGDVDIGRVDHGRRPS